MSFNIHSRPVNGALVGSGAAFGMAMDHQPPIWVAIAGVGGFTVGWLTTPQKTRTQRSSREEDTKMTDG
jgi:hypothetical protein